MKVRWEPNQRTPEEEVRAYCREWADVIFVREKVEGRWRAVSLTELPEDLRQKWIGSFVEQGMIPRRIVRHDDRH